MQPARAEAIRHVSEAALRRPNVARWYVDFDKCLPFFNENLGCGICLAVCPFSRPLIGARLVRKLAAKRG